MVISSSIESGIAEVVMHKPPVNALGVRDWFDLAEGDFPWLDGIAGELAWNNLTIPVVLKDTHFHLVDDWASFESTPAYAAENVAAVGLYTADQIAAEIPEAVARVESGLDRDDPRRMAALALLDSKPAVPLRRAQLAKAVEVGFGAAEERAGSPTVLDAQ